MKAIITGDIVCSELIPLENRDALISVLQGIVEDMQSKSSMKMELFRGDSFQIVVDRPEMSLEIASMIRAGLKLHTPQNSKMPWDARISVGIGSIEYHNSRIVISDGEAFRLSGRGLDAMGKEKRLSVNTCWHGMNEILDVGIAFVDDIITGWSVNQANAIYLSVVKGFSQTEIAKRISKSQQNVSKTLISAKETLIYQSLNLFKKVVVNKIENK